MSYTKDDVDKIVGVYAIALRERRLVFSKPQRSVLEEVLRRELGGVKEKGKKEEKLYGIALIQKLASPSLTVMIREHAVVLYGQEGGVKKYTENDLLGLYHQATKGIEGYRFRKMHTGIARRVPLGIAVLYTLERYFLDRGKIQERPFMELLQRQEGRAQRQLLREPQVMPAVVAQPVKLDKKGKENERKLKKGQEKKAPVDDFADIDDVELREGQDTSEDDEGEWYWSGS